MESIRAHLFKDSFGPFITLLNESSVRYGVRVQRSAGPVASSELIEILGSAAMWGALATVICGFLKNRRSRKVIITLKDKTVVHAEGLSQEELEKILARAESISAIETKKEES